MSDSLKKISDSLIRSFLVSKMSDSLTLLIFSEQPERIAHGRSFFGSEMSDSQKIMNILNLQSYSKNFLKLFAVGSKYGFD